MNDDIAIKIDDVSKYFEPSKTTGSIKSLLVDVFRKKQKIEKEGFWALKDVGFEIKKGEFFGIVGRNGSGKSTLLKMIAGVYSPTKGNITVNGKLVPFIELGVGFNPELSGRDNVFLNGALLGFSRKELTVMYDEIVEFAELKDHMDVKLKNFSSGMQVRLAFSIAIRAKSDILLIDEVLAVGDTLFQQKCYEYFYGLKKARQTVVFVSHDMDAVAKFCHSAALIEDKKLITVGNTRKVVSEYQKQLYGNNSSNTSRSKTQNKLFKISLNKDVVTFGDELAISLSLSDEKTIQNIGVAIYSSAGVYINGTNSIIKNISIKGGDTLKISYPVQLAPGKYNITIGVFGENDSEVLEMATEVAGFNVTRSEAMTEGQWQGVAFIDSKWSVKE